MVPLPRVGRSFSGQRKVRLGDVRPDAELRLDALTRYTQDVSNDDTTAAELPDDMAWVVRRTTVDVHRPATFAEDLTFTTFCSGLGRRWAERRLVVRGRRGAEYEVSTLWIHLDVETGRPRSLSAEFHALYAEAAQGREVGARLQNPPLWGDPERIEWPTRVVDFDVFGHMNNAAYWAVVEELLPTTVVEAPFRCVIEYGRGISTGDQVTIACRRSDGEMDAWWLVDGDSVASLRIALLGQRSGTLAVGDPVLGNEEG